MTLLSTWHKYITQNKEVDVVQRKGGFSVVAQTKKQWDFQIATAYFSHKLSVIIVVPARNQSTADTNKS